jgi:SAM-dependent methyltransferase
MKAKEESQANFGNWVPVKLIVGPALLGAVCLALSLWHASFLIPAMLFLVIGAYFGAAWYLFSAEGGKVQSQVQALVVDQLHWSGQGTVLDIGCGNGPLALQIAERHPDAKVVGVDYWGKNWDYSIQVCQENARHCGVAQRVSFQRGTAAALPFEAGQFDVVVSNLVFHEVADTQDKRQCIREALRVLKPGGIFVLQDLFLLKSYYGTPAELVKTVQGWHADEVEFIRTCDARFIPALVKLPFMVGTLAILRGRKTVLAVAPPRRPS